MNKTNFLMLFFLLLLASFPSMAQRNFKVTGKVVSTSDGLELPGVTVLIKGTRIGTTTDFNGTFSINIDEKKDILVFSMIGLKEKEIAGIKEPNLRVELSEETQELEGVLVVGYGVQKKASSVGAITQTKGDELVKSGGATNISASLSGLLPGVTAIQVSGEPGQDYATITIRGKSTWGNTDPLILVDGIERSFNEMDPNEIESVSVLKDASATAVYGVKGANGVILITTKRGVKGETKINFSSNFGLKQTTRSWDYTDHVTAMNIYNQAYINERSWDVLYSEQYIDNWRYKRSQYYYPELDWSELLYKSFAPSQQYNLNISGGSSFIKYFVSVGYLKDDDILKTEKQPEYDPRFYYERYNYRANLDMSITKTTDLSINLSGDLSIRNRTLGTMGSNPFTGGPTGQQLFDYMYSTPNYYFPVRYEDGMLAQSPRGPEWNPIVNLNYQGSGRLKSSVLFTDVILNQDLSAITKGLSAKMELSYNTTNGFYRIINKKVLTRYQADENTEPIYSPAEDYVEKPASYGGETLQTYNRDLYYEASLNYGRKFGKHEVSALALFNRRNREPNTEFPYYEESWVGRTTYNFSNRYFGEFNCAYTGSEKFAPGKRFGFFPSIAAGWMITEEPFFKALNVGKVVNSAKLAYSYGEVGSDRGASRFTYITDYSSGSYTTFGDEQAYNDYILYFEGGAANVNATWESTKKQNLRLELGLVDKLSVAVDLWNENRENILMRRDNTTPMWFGQTSPYANIGKVKSHGYDIEATWRDKINNSLSYFVKTGFSFNENRVEYRDDPTFRLEYQKAAGKPIGYTSLIHQTDILRSWDDVFNYTGTVNDLSYRQPGDFTYNDYNGDGVIDENDRLPRKLTDEPAYTLSLNFGFSYKNFDFRALFYGVSGVEKPIPSAMLWDLSSWNAVAWKQNSDYWTKDNVDATKPRPSIRIYTNETGNDFGRLDASYIRLKSVELSYNIKSASLKKYIGLDKLQVYLNGDNLLTLTPFDDRVDPEAASTSLYPITKRYNIGCRISF